MKHGRSISRWRARVTTGAVVAVLTVTSTVASGEWTLAGAAPCSTDVFVVTVNGSGQGGTGQFAETGDANNLIQQQVKAAGEDIEVTSKVVQYTAASLDVLKRDPVGFMASIEDGRKKTVAMLKGLASELRAPGCGSAQVVLTGFSQGSMAIRRALIDLAADGSPEAKLVVERISMVLLVSDPTKMPFDYVTYLGSATNLSTGIGVATDGYRQIPAIFAGRVYSMCTAFDAACDASTVAAAAAAASRIHVIGDDIAKGIVDSSLKIHGESYRNGFVARNETLKERVSTVLAPKATKAASERIEQDRRDKKPKPNPTPTTPPKPTTPPPPSDLVCRDLPGTADDVKPRGPDISAVACQASGSGSATLLSDNKPGEHNDFFDFGQSKVVAADGALALVRADNSAVVWAQAGTGSTIDARVSGYSLAKLDSDSGSTLRLVQIDGPQWYTDIRASNGSAVDINASGSSSAGGQASGRSIVRVSATGGSGVHFDADSAGAIVVNATNGASVGASASGGTITAVVDESTTVELEALFGAKLDADIHGTNADVTATATEGADLTLTAGGGSGDEVVTRVNVTAGRLSAVNVTTQGAGSQSTVVTYGVPQQQASTVVDIPVVEVVTLDGGSTLVWGSGIIAGVLLSDGAKLSVSSNGAGSSAEVKAYRIVGTLTVVATEGGRAYFYSDQAGYTQIRCEGGVTSIRSDVGSCSSNGDVALYRYADGSEQTIFLNREQSDAGPQVDREPDLDPNLISRPANSITSQSQNVVVEPISARPASDADVDTSDSSTERLTTSNLTSAAGDGVHNSDAEQALGPVDVPDAGSGESAETSVTPDPAHRPETSVTTDPPERDLPSSVREDESENGVDSN